MSAFSSSCPACAFWRTSASCSSLAVSLSAAVRASLSACALASSCALRMSALSVSSSSLAA